MEQAIAVANDDPYAETVDPRAAEQKLLEAADPIVQRLTRLADDAVSKRRGIEQRWIEDLCQYAGVRSVNELRDKAKPLETGQSKTETGSQVFVNITRGKTNRTEGRLCDILFPADDRNWSIDPTPVPELATIAQQGKQQASQAIERANALRAEPEATTAPDGMDEGDLVQMAGDLGQQAKEAQEVLDEAKKRAERMEMEIDDQLVEARYAIKSRDAISWACKLGVGVLKGPIVLDKGKNRWKKREDGVFELAPSTSSARPSVECISPWSFFPDPSATTIEDAEYVFERHFASKRDLRRMAREMGFNKARVRELLEGGAETGTPEDLRYLSDIRMLTGEDTAVADRFIIWEFHGQLEVGEVATLIRSGGDAESAARAEEYEASADPLDNRMVIAWFCNNQLLKLTEYYPMDSDDLLYSVFSLEKGNASILGAIGIPRMMRDSQEALNAAWRMMMDNAALSVGPQILVDQKSVTPAPGEDWKMRPRKVWQKTGESASAGPPFEVFNVPMNQEQIGGIIALSKAFIDDETSMPSIIEGGMSEERTPGAASTVGGFAMMLNAAGVNTRRMVKNWDDDVTNGMVTRFYDWNMQHSDKDEIKGDMSVQARGTSVLLAREMQAQNLMAIATQWSVHPVLGGMIKTYDVASHALKAVSISPSDGLLSEDEYEQKMQQAAEQQGQQPEDPQWQIRLQIAQGDQQTRLQVAEIEREVAMMKLAQEEKITIEDIAARLQAVRERAAAEERKAQIKSNSDERKLASEIGADRAAAREARSMGLPAPGSGGAVNFGDGQ